MKIYTKKGDEGKTLLLGGTRVFKSDLRIESYGTVDELNAIIGMLGDYPETSFQIERIRAIQHDLFNIGSHLANDPEKSKFQLPPFDASAIVDLEESIDQMNEELPPLKNFILPGGHLANSTAHLGRTVCRRAERRVVALNQESPLDPAILKYLNRLSDWLFVFGRAIVHKVNGEEILWKP
ncbi:MAG: cob(I)yrinic acid a,c-diamide adenosyltransferase [Bacteroidota bacterium]